jgi:hypothetical protein
MSEPDRNKEPAVRERAYHIWEQEGRPIGRAQDHWERAIIDRLGEQRGHISESMEDEEKILDGRLDANIPQLLTKDVFGG